jgi:hypothetical protein
MMSKVGLLEDACRVDGSSENYDCTIVFVNDLRTNWRIWEPLVQSLVHGDHKIRTIRYSKCSEMKSDVHF